LAGKARSRLVGGGEGGDVSTQKWTCPVCTAAGNTGSNCIQCKATPYDMPVESASSDDDLLSDKDVKQFQRECVDDLNKRSGVRLNKLLFSQGHSNACAGISMYMSVYHTLSGESHISDEVFRHASKNVGRDIVNKIRLQESSGEAAFVTLESVKEFFEPFFPNYTDTITHGDIYLNPSRRSLLDHLNKPNRKVAIGKLCLHMNMMFLF